MKIYFAYIFMFARHVSVYLYIFSKKKILDTQENLLKNTDQSLALQSNRLVQFFFRRSISIDALFFFAFAATQFFQCLHFTHNFHLLKFIIHKLYCCTKAKCFNQKSFNDKHRRIGNNSLNCDD